ncbi:MAG: hypothetical protein LBU27_09655 [Candidatus Peribacteria bacterium]|nr:hypothetical protein [Candidatus Peribacteria bacterium]
MYIYIMKTKKFLFFFTALLVLFNQLGMDYVLATLQEEGSMSETGILAEVPSEDEAEG